MKMPSIASPMGWARKNERMETSQNPWYGSGYLGEGGMRFMMMRCRSVESAKAPSARMSAELVLLVGRGRSGVDSDTPFPFAWLFPFPFACPFPFALADGLVEGGEKGMKGSIILSKHLLKI